EMDTGRRLTEQRHDDRIAGIRAGKFHVVGKLAGRDALQHELAGVRVFALVALERKVQKPQPDGGGDDERRYHEPPRPMSLKKSGGRGRRDSGRRHARQLNKSAAGRQADLPDAMVWKRTWTSRRNAVFMRQRARLIECPAG